MERVPTVASFWVKTAAAAMATDGLDLNALFVKAELDWASLADPDARFPIAGFHQLFRIGARESGNDAFGIPKGPFACSAAFGVVAYPMMSSANLSELLRCLTKYVRLIADETVCRLEHEGADSRLSVDLPDPVRAPIQAYGSCLFVLLTFCRWVTAFDIRPQALKLTGRKIFRADVYEEAFGCPAIFECDANALVFAGRDLKLALPTRNRLLSAIHNQVAEEQLGRIETGSIRGRIGHAIARRLKSGAVTRRIIAAQVAMSERTMTRRLQEEGTSFRDVLDHTRRQLVVHYVKEKSIALSQIAYMLGFTDRRSLFRAWKRWFGTTPRGRSD